MNKKILLGSIIAVVILVLVSFTGVVGFQSVKPSTIAKASPLFSVRSKRAIDETSKDIACDYVGKGSILPFPKRDDRTVLVQKFIDSISTMDDETFQRVIDWIYQNYKVKSENMPKSITKIYNLPESNIAKINYNNYIKEINPKLSPTSLDCDFTLKTPLLCVLFGGILELLAIPFLILWIIGALLGLWPMLTAGETACTWQCH